MTERDGQEPELEKANPVERVLYRVVDLAGLSSGIGIVAWGAWWGIWHLVLYFVTTPETAINEIVHENYFNQVQLSFLLVAIGVLIMEVRKLRS